jgi:hypothetical protein
MDQKHLEQQQLDRLTNEPITRKIGKFNFRFREPFLSTLDHLSAVSIKMEFNEEKLKENITPELNRLKRNSSLLIAKYVAYFWLEKPWKIKLFGGIISKYIANNTSPSILLNLVVELKILENDPAFINSIRFLAQTQRTSQPKADLVEQKD